MILSVNKVNKFKLTNCPQNFVEKASLIKLDDIIYKMDNPEQDFMNYSK